MLDHKDAMTGMNNGAIVTVAVGIPTKIGGV